MKTTNDRQDAFDDVLKALSRAPSVRPADIDLTGRTVGRFVVERRLGHGGMGVVYEARDPVLARNVALKVLRASHQDSAAIRSRLHEEARRLAALHHPHIAAVYDVGEHEGIVFLAMERAGGRSLRARLATPPALSLARAMAILRAISGGLAGAHEAGIIHRDLKPENVVVGDGGTVKIIDFGIATASGSGSSGSRPAGTRRYMAPEQAAGAPASPRADIFAFGVLAREVLSATAVTPHERLTRAALGRLAAACSAEEPEKRPRDGADLLAHLDAIAPGRGLVRPGALTFGIAAVAATLGVVVARSVPEAPTRASSAGPSRFSQRSHMAHEGADTTVAPFPALLPPHPVQVPDAPDAAEGARDDRSASGPRGTATGERAPGAGRASIERENIFDRSPFANGAENAVPVTASVDSHGRLVATVGFGGAPSPSKGPGALATLGAIDPTSAQAKVIPDGNGGAVIRVTLRVKAPASSGSSHAFGPGSLPIASVSVAGTSSGSSDDVTIPVLTLPGPDSNPPADPSASKTASHAGEPTVVLCAATSPAAVRTAAGPNGEVVLTVIDAHAETVLAVIDSDGEVLELGPAASECDARDISIDG